MSLSPEAIDWNKGDGLVPLVVQHAHDGRVLMLGWSDRAALELTLASGRIHFWSRSRQRLWKKGETSGHLQKVVELWIDCDGDTILAKVEQTGPACHTGSETCFFERLK